jgi:hypothetical protein
MPATNNPTDLIQTGDANRLYLDIASDPATPNWVELVLVDEATINDEPEAVAVPGRFPDRVKRSMYGQIDGSISFALTVLKNDAVIAYLRNRKRMKKAVQIMTADRDRAAAGVISIIDWFMVSMPEKQPSSGNTTVDVTLTPTVVTDNTGAIIPRKYTPVPA